MTNEIKNSPKKTVKKKTANQKKKVAPKQEISRARPVSNVDYETRLARHKRAAMRRTLIFVTAIAAAVVLLVVFVEKRSYGNYKILQTSEQEDVISTRYAEMDGKILRYSPDSVSVLLVVFVEKRSYGNYKILQTSEQEDVISTRYAEMDGKILRYSPDSVSLVNKRMETQWSETHAMQNPIADVRGSYAVVADRDGTTMEIYDRDGLTGSVSTSYSIIKARISQNGLVAAILANGEDTWINFYSYDGSLIVENQTKMDDPGYPLDVAVSNDGLVMMVTYQFVDGGDTTSYVAFYNFGDVGQNEDDRIVSGYTYEGVVIPQVLYLGGSNSVAVREDGFTLYKGKQIPKEHKTAKVEKEIVSTFFDKDTIGLVFKSGDKEKPYTMEVYNTDGNLKFEKKFGIPYTTVKMSGGNILLYNNSQICVMNSRGVEKYIGTIDGVVNDFFKIGWNKYLLVLDSGVNVIKFT